MIRLALKNYFKFSGRSTKKEYWPFFALIAGTYVALSIITLDAVFRQNLASYIIFWIGFVFWLFLLIPFLSLSWRRFHDIGKSGLWTLILLIPIVGLVLYLIWMSVNSDGDNLYGPKKQ